MRLTSPWKSRAYVLALSLLGLQPAHAFDWANLWSSAEQRAARQLEQQQYDELIGSAPDANWRGLGEYRKGDYAAAAQSFAEQSEQYEQLGLADKRTQASYNQANAHVQEAQYEQAINLYNEILESNPRHDNAKHNLDIAQQLLEQEQQQQQNSDEQSDEQKDNQSSDDQQSSDQQSGEGDNADQQESEQNQGQSADQDSEQQKADSGAQDGESAQDESAQSEQQLAEQEAAAARAMQAEQQRQSDAEQTPNEAESQSEQQPTAPLTEREQANEQWLRKIPDDPAGLLQRKLQNRHATDFPKVKDSDQPW